MRTRMVTRTVKTNHITALAVDTAKGELINRAFYLTGDYTEKELEKLSKKFIEQEENVKYVSIKSMYTEEQIYGMSEEEFVSLAKPITR